MNAKIKNFTTQDILSIVFVIASILNIIASDKEKEYLFTSDPKDKKAAYNIYILVLLIIIILYLYFLKANYKTYCDSNLINKKSNLVRLYGSIFFLLGALCFLYYRIDNKNKIQNSVEI